MQWGFDLDRFVVISGCSGGGKSTLLGAQLIEVEVDDRLQLVRQPRSFEVGRQAIEPSAVFDLRIDLRRWGGAV